MIVVTGAAGFIASALVTALNDAGYRDIVVVDDFSRPDKAQNLVCAVYRESVHRDRFFSWWGRHHADVAVVFHLGARTNTAEHDILLLNCLNLDYSKQVWRSCVAARVPLIYASSAATYGLGEFGYDDDHARVPLLKPLNPYGASKQAFDEWVLQQETAPPFWAGLKFFNVYGSPESHKGRMASVVFHAFCQIQAAGRVRLFRSHREDIADGEQSRDFVYVKDVVKVCLFFMDQTQNAGIYNVGSGHANSFLSLAKCVFSAMDRPVSIEWMDTPEDIRPRYQYFTEAKIDKLRGAGFVEPFHSLGAGVNDYMQRLMGH